MCVHKMVLTGRVITGRFEKRELGDDQGFPFYCDGEEAKCSICSGTFIIPPKGFHCVEIEPIPIDPAKVDLSKRP